jgi:predicted membrane channel-forming protein YqfA (hemolysin III family)
MTTDAWLFIFLGIVQTWTAIQGGIVSARALPVGRERNFHIVTFVLLGVLGVGLISWQALNVSKTEKEATAQ